MSVEMIKFAILALLIVISLGTLFYIKSQKPKEKNFEGFQVSDPMPRDFDNKNLDDSQIYGDIPQSATISIFRKAELKGLTANPDAIPVADGDSKGRGGGPQLQITSIPPQEIPADDIEAVLNEAIDAPITAEDYVEEFTDSIEGFGEYDNIEGFQRKAPVRKPLPKAAPKAAAPSAPSASSVVNRAASVASTASNLTPGNADAAKAAQVLAIAADPKAAAQAKAAEEAAKLGIKLPVLPTHDSSTPQGAAANLLQQKAMDKGSLALQKAKNAVAKRLKNTKLAKMAGKAATKAKAIALKGVKKVTEKIAGVFAKKIGAKLGAKATESIFKKVATKLVTKITAAVGKASAKAAALSSNPVTVGFGIVLTVITAIATSVGIALPIILKGDEGVCDPGWRKISDVWPSYLDLIPGVGDIMGVIAPYICYLDGCDSSEQEDAGLCYPHCDKGYDGVGPVCWNKATETEPKGPGIPKGCPDGWQDDGALICKERSGRICGDDCSKGWDNCRRRGLLNECWGGCREGCSDVYLGRWIGKLNNANDGGNLLKCSSDREEIDFLTGQAPTSISVLPLCYGKCPLISKPIGTVTTTKYPIYIKKRPSKNADAAEKALIDAIAVKTTSTETLKQLQKNIGDAMGLDLATPIPADAPYIRNPDGPRIGSETAAVTAPRRWPLTETQYYTDLLAGIENGRVVFYSKSLGGWQSFESIFGGYGITFLTGNVKVKKVSMTYGGPHVLAQDGTLWRWVQKIMDWESSAWGVFKDIAAVNNDFTYCIGMDDRIYYWRWKNNARGISSSGGLVESSWTSLIAIAANDTGNVNNDHGNLLSTNSAGWSATKLDYKGGALFGNDKTFDKAGMNGQSASDVAMSQDVVSPGNNNFMQYISTKQGYILAAKGQGPWDAGWLPNPPQKIDGPIPGSPITAITASTGFPDPSIYVVCNGRLFVSAEKPGSEPTKMNTKTTFEEQRWPGMPPWMRAPAMPKITLVENPNYQAEYAAWIKKVNEIKASGAVNGWLEIKGKTLTDIAIGPPVKNDEYTRFVNYSSYLKTMEREVYSKYPIPTPNTDEDKIPVLTETITSTREERMKHIPLLPYLCMGNRGLAYGRGVGKPKLKLKMVTRTPPPPPPPSLWNSAAFAEDPDTKCKVDFSDVKVLQEICDFYYQAAVSNSDVKEGGSVSFGYISKINKIIGSSEQSADIMCDITNVVINSETGKLMSSSIVPNSDRRIYFAKIEKICSFIIVGTTNTNGTGPDIKSATDEESKTVNFTPIIKKCVNVPIGLKKCQSKETIDAMIAMYKKTLPATVRIKSIDAIQDSGTDVCAVAWKEVNYDPSTNIESQPSVKVVNFKFQQDKTTDACLYKVQSYSIGNSNSSIKPLDKPIVYEEPLPAEVSLQGCSTTCKDPIMIQKLVKAFNTGPRTSRILSVNKVVTPSPLRCDMEAEVFVAETKMKENQKIRFDLSKEGGSCVFNVTNVGNAGSGTFIQNNTKSLEKSISTKDFIVSSQIETVKSAQTNIASTVSKITKAQGLANTSYEKTFAQFGQSETLGSCSKKCSDADVLNSIITHYNTTNYPQTRTNVIKKTITRILKAGTADKNICDILFEEKQEKYNDLYTDTPITNVTQKTQRFTMKDNGSCNFIVDDTPLEEAVSEEGFRGGLPMKKEGFQSIKRASVINSQTPSLTPVYTGSGCELDCTNSDILNNMKQKFQSNNIEGFKNRNRYKGFFSNIFSSFSESFQDSAESEEVPTTSEEVPTTSEEVPTDTGVSDWNTTSTNEESATTDVDVAEAEPTPKSVSTINMKKVNRALKLGVNKCEYEVVYDSSETDSNGNSTSINDTIGYFTGTFSKSSSGCSYSANQVIKSVTPVIPTVSNTKTSNISFSF